MQNSPFVDFEATDKKSHFIAFAAVSLVVLNPVQSNGQMGRPTQNGNRVTLLIHTQHCAVLHPVKHCNVKINAGTQEI